MLGQPLVFARLVIYLLSLHPLCGGRDLLFFARRSRHILFLLSLEIPARIISK